MGGTFSIPEIVVIVGFVSALVGISGWVLNLEIRKADRSEIIGKAYTENLERILDSIQIDLRYLRERLDELVKNDHERTPRRGTRE